MVEKLYPFLQFAKSSVDLTEFHLGKLIERTYFQAFDCTADDITQELAKIADHFRAPDGQKLTSKSWRYVRKGTDTVIVVTCTYEVNP